MSKGALHAVSYAHRHDRVDARAAGRSGFHERAGDQASTGGPARGEPSLRPLLRGAAGAHLPLLLGHRQSGERPGAGPLSDAVVLQHRRGRLRRSRRIRSASSAATSRASRHAQRMLATLRFLRNAPQGAAGARHDGLQGLLLSLPRHEDRRARSSDSELSTVDTALLLAGALFCQSYFDGADPRGGGDPRARRRASTGASTGTGRSRSAPAITLGWSPEEGFLEYDWRGYNEAMLVYLLALGSPTHPVGPEAWSEWTSTYDKQLGHDFGPGAPELRAAVRPPVHARVDRLPRHPGRRTCASAASTTSRTAGARPTRSAPTRSPIRAVQGYGANVWGLTACDGPADLEIEDASGTRALSQLLRPAASVADRHDTTTARSRRPRRSASHAVRAGDRRFPRCSTCTDASASTSTRSTASSTRSIRASTSDVPLRHGRFIPGFGWVAGDYLGIDQGADRGDDRELPQRARLAT